MEKEIIKNKSENFKKFLDSLDEDLTKIFEFQKEYIVCKKGCSLCCKKGDYPLSQTEFDYLMQGYNALDEALKSKIKEKIQKIDNPDSYECPFLIDDACCVYNQRPIVCRAFGVLTEDIEGKPKFPFCALEGLNYSNIWDEENKVLSSQLAIEKGYKVFPAIYRLSNKVIMNLPKAKELKIDFGRTARLIDFLRELFK